MFSSQHRRRTGIPAESFNTVKFMHISLEYSNATLGGLGSVVTQMQTAQNKFSQEGKARFNASVITPLYSKIFSYDVEHDTSIDIEHLFDNRYVKSTILLFSNGGNCHFVIKPKAPYADIFDIESSCQIYNDNEKSTFLDRIKYFSSAVASFLSKCVSDPHIPAPNIIALHGWHIVLAIRLLRNRYENESIKSMFIIHTCKDDNGIFSSESLSGIGLNLPQGFHDLKAIGIIESNRVITVSPRCLESFKAEDSDNANFQILTNIFNVLDLQDEKPIAILNGIEYQKYCPLGTLILDKHNISEEKIRLRYKIMTIFTELKYSWSIDPQLPLILYIGRFSPEKGVDTFAQVVAKIQGRANFVALGRGMTETVYNFVSNMKKGTRNVLISNHPQIQKLFGELFRASADFMFVPSYAESCGLIPMEGYANGAATIASTVLHDALLPSFSYTFSHSHQTEVSNSLDAAINKALVDFAHKSTSQKNVFQASIIEAGEIFDWNAPGGSIATYADIATELLPGKIGRPALRNVM